MEREDWRSEVLPGACFRCRWGGHGRRTRAGAGSRSVASARRGEAQVWSRGELGRGPGVGFRLPMAGATGWSGGASCRWRIHCVVGAGEAAFYFLRRCLEVLTLPR